MDNKELSFGEKAVGLTFNPSGDEKVTKVKKLYAEIIDLIDAEGAVEGKGAMGQKILEQAVVHAMSAQMWAVKGITFKE